MKDFFLRNKVFIISVIATCVLIVGGILLMSGGESPTALGTTTINSSILTPEGTYKTSGLINGEYLMASESSKVTLVEFGDYVCPACAANSPLIEQILTDFAGEITFVFRNYPLSYHTNAYLASYAVEAAGIQGHYWDMHKKMYATSNEWSGVADPTDIFVGYVKEMGLDTDKFSVDMGSQAVKDAVARDVADGDIIGLTETPTFYLNGNKITLSRDSNQIRNLIQSELAK